MEANKENQQSIEQAFEQALDAYKAGKKTGAARGQRPLHLRGRAAQGGAVRDGSA